MDPLHDAMRHGCCTELDRLREENARLWELSVWGTSEPVGPKYDEILRLRQRVEELERALSFYADTRRYQGSNQPYRDGDDPFTPARSPYLIDAHRDGGAIARAALAAAKGE